MKLQTIKSRDGRIEYVLLPLSIYRILREQIDNAMSRFEVRESEGQYVRFDPADYVDNPVALARIGAGLTQKELASRLGVSQAYISKVENQDAVSPKLLVRVMKLLKGKGRQAG